MSKCLGSDRPENPRDGPLGPDPVPYVARHAGQGLDHQYLRPQKTSLPHRQTYEQMDIENLFSRGISLDDLTDYKLARALEKMAERGLHEIFFTICLRAICHEQISLKYLNKDTTSISVHGVYDYYETTDPDFFITFGHSKAKRFDLKQFLYGLSVTLEFEVSVNVVALE